MTEESIRAGVEAMVGIGVEPVCLFGEPSFILFAPIAEAVPDSIRMDALMIEPSDDGMATKITHLATGRTQLSPHNRCGHGYQVRVPA